MSKTESRNREALDTRTWLDEHGDALYRFALLRVRNSTVAEDLVQDTLLAGLQGKTRFAGGSSVRTWLIGILKNKIIDHMRRTGREGVLPEEPIDDVCDAMFREDHSYHWRVMPSVWDDPDGALEQQEFWEAFYRCLGDLPERQS
ncbi:MAG: sigma-70 family RNA polymerase sigma factor, partial [Pseudomonadota bacterium]